MVNYNWKQIVFGIRDMMVEDDNIELFRISNVFINDIKRESSSCIIRDIEKDIEVRDIISSFDFSSYDTYSSEECKNKLAALRQEEKQLLQDNKAVLVTSTGSKKQINNNIKQIIRCFNAECDNIALSITVKNIDTLRNKVSKSFDTINKIMICRDIFISTTNINCKII